MDMIEGARKINENHQKVKEAEAKLVESGAVRFASMRWANTHLMGVLVDGRTVLIKNAECLFDVSADQEPQQESKSEEKPK